MNEWPVVTIGEVAEVFDGPHATPRTVREGPIFLGIGSLQSGRLNLGETRHVTPEDFKKWTRRVRPMRDDVVFSYETRLGEAAIIPEGMECCLGRRMGLVRTDREKLLPRFFLYYYLSPTFQAFLRSRTIHGATVDRIALKEFPSFPVPVPPLREQYKIAELLGSLDDKIELNRRMNATLEAMAQATFRDWFVDFGPTRRKMDGATDPVTVIGGLVTDPGRAKQLAELFPAWLANNGLPEGWEERPFSAFVEIIGGGTPKTSVSDYWAGDLPWFSVVDTPSNGSVYVHATEKRISDRGLQESSARLVRAGTTIISARGTVGNLALAATDMTFNQSCYGLQGLAGVGDGFVFLAAQQAVERLKGMAHGSVFSTITRATFDSLQVARAPDEILSAFEGMTEPLFAKIKSTGSEIITLAATRDLLLPQLMSGEIRLGDEKVKLEGVL